MDTHRFIASYAGKKLGECKSDAKSQAVRKNWQKAVDSIKSRWKLVKAGEIPHYSNSSKHAKKPLP